MSQSKNNLIVTMADIRAAGGCAPGARAWFRHYGLDFKRFITDGGINADILAATGDAMATRVISAAQQRLNNGR